MNKYVSQWSNCTIISESWSFDSNYNHHKCPHPQPQLDRFPTARPYKNLKLVVILQFKGQKHRLVSSAPGQNTCVRGCEVAVIGLLILTFMVAMQHRAWLVFVLILL